MIIILALLFMLADVLFRLIPTSWTFAAILLWCGASFTQRAKAVLA